MKYQITQTQTGGDWELTMTCEFANETIARLIKEDTKINRYGHNREYLVTKYENVWAKIEIGGQVITLTSWNKHGSVLMFNNMQDTKTRMETTAQSWQEQEAKYLPTMRYFEARTKDVFKEWFGYQSERMIALENQVEQVRFGLETIESKAKGDAELVASQLQEHDETLTDLGDCLDKDYTRLDRIESALGKHLRQTLAHFPCVGKRIILEKV